jgi:hypothetical protein
LVVVVVFNCFSMLCLKFKLLQTYLTNSSMIGQK